MPVASCEVLREIGEEGYLAFYGAQCEARMAQLHELSVQQGRMAKYILVLDVRDITVWTLTSRAWSSFDKRHLNGLNKSMAEAIARIYVINAPGWLAAFYNRAIRYMLPHRTQSKLFFLGGPAQYEPQLEAILSGDTLAELLEHIGEASSPAGSPIRRGRPSQKIASSPR